MATAAEVFWGGLSVTSAVVGLVGVALAMDGALQAGGGGGIGTGAGVPGE